MSKKLSEMSLEELWQLFPIFLTEHDSRWGEVYADERDILDKALPQAVRISHIGSTSISAIWAKPIVDILVELPVGCDLSAVEDVLTDVGYVAMSRSDGRLSLNKGYTEEGFAEKVFHLHLRYIGDNDELYFRDYLLDHPDVAHDYEQLKLKLWKQFEHNRDGYTDAKTDFIRKYTEIARELYSGRY